jgi:hypothetical protein
MAPVIRFRSRFFDVSKEPENPINPFRGSSILEWLRARLPDGVTASEVLPEDWGWYFDADWSGRRYMVGALAEEDTGGDVEWAIQFEKSRTLKEKLLGRENLRAGDPVVTFVLDHIRGESAFTAVSIEGED